MKSSKSVEEYPINHLISIGAAVLLFSSASGNANAQATCFAVKQYHANIISRSEAFFDEYPMSSSCAVVMGSTALVQFSEKTKDVEDELGSALTVVCGMYCVFGSEAACGYASTALLQYGLEITAAQSAIDEVCSP